MKISLKTQMAEEKKIVTNMLQNIHNESAQIFQMETESSVKTTILSDHIKAVGYSTYAICKVDEMPLWYIVEDYNDGCAHLRAESPFFTDTDALILEFNSLKERAFVA